MNFLEKVASFADQYSNTAEGEEGILLKVASDMDVRYEDMVALHNIVDANVFTGEGVVKIAEEAEPSRLAMVGDLWEKIANEEIGEEGMLLAAEEIGMDSEEIAFVLDALDKQAEEAGLYADEDGKEAVAGEGEGEGEEAGITADDATWEKIAEAHTFLADADIDVMAALDFAVDMSEAEDEEAGEKVASEYGDLDDEMMDKIAEAVEFLGDVDGAYDLMDAYDKEAKSLLQSGADFVTKDRRSVGKAVSDGFGKYKAAITGAGSKKVKKRLKLNEKRVSLGRESNQKRSAATKASAEKIRAGGAGKSKSVQDKANSLALKKETKGKQAMKSLNKRQAGREAAVTGDKKSLKQIRTTQAKAVGGTALVAGGGAAAAYNKANEK